MGIFSDLIGGVLFQSFGDKDKLDEAKRRYWETKLSAITKKPKSHFEEMTTKELTKVAIEQQNRENRKKK